MRQECLDHKLSIRLRISVLYRTITMLSYISLQIDRHIPIFLTRSDIMPIRIRWTSDQDRSIVTNDVLSDELGLDCFSNSTTSHGSEFSGYQEHDKLPNTEHLDMDDTRLPVIRECGLALCTEQLRPSNPCSCEVDTNRVQ
jgi:hypothetical protein